MSRRSSRIEGFRETDAGLQGLEKVTKRETVMRILDEAAQPFADTMRAMAPRDRGDLADSIGVGDQLSPRQAAQHEKLAEFEVFAGPGGTKGGPKQAIFMEFGTFKDDAQPFVRPAWDANKRKALEEIRGGLSEEVIKRGSNSR